MELPSEMPVMTLPGAILFPRALLPLYIFEPRYRLMLADALASHRMFSVAMQRPNRTREEPCGVAGVGLIRASVARKDGASNLVLQGIARVELGRTTRYKPYRVHCIRPIKSVETAGTAISLLTNELMELVSARLKQGFELPLHTLQKLGTTENALSEELPADPANRRGIEIFSKFDSPDQIADLVSSTLLSSPFERQLLLETIDLETRLRHLIHFLTAEIHRQKKN